MIGHLFAVMSDSHEILTVFPERHVLCFRWIEHQTVTCNVAVRKPVTVEVVDSKE